MMVIFIVLIGYICLKQNTNQNHIKKSNVKIKFLKSVKTPSIIYADLESLIKKIDECKNNHKKLPTTKVG